MPRQPSYSKGCVTNAEPVSATLLALVELAVRQKLNHESALTTLPQTKYDVNVFNFRFSFKMRDCPYALIPNCDPDRSAPSLKLSLVGLGCKLQYAPCL